MIRLILRYLANNEQLVQRLSESYPMRQAAKLVVRFFNKGRGYILENRLDEKLTPEQFRNLMKKFAEGIQREIMQAKNELKKRNK